MSAPAAVFSSSGYAPRVGARKLAMGVSSWLGNGEQDAEALASQAELAESLGFHSFWLPESHFTGEEAEPAPLLRLAAVASRTRRIGLGTSSFLLPLRHPLLSAEEVAVLDQLSGGRVILGVGRGFRRATFEAFDIPPREKRDRFEAALTAMLAAWRGEPVTWEALPDGGGSRPLRLSPLPLQKPHPPIWVAAFGPKALAQAGRLGLPYLASPIESLVRLTENYARHRAVLAECDHSLEIDVPVMRTIFTHRDAGVLSRARVALAKEAQMWSRMKLTGPGDSIEDIDSWALVGEPEAVSDGLHTYREKLGMTHLIARPRVSGLEPESCVESLGLLAELAL